MDNLIKSFFGSDDTVAVNDYEILMNSGFPFWAGDYSCRCFGSLLMDDLQQRSSQCFTMKRKVILSALRFGTCFILVPSPSATEN